MNYCLPPYILGVKKYRPTFINRGSKVTNNYYKNLYIFTWIPSDLYLTASKLDSIFPGIETNIEF